MLAALGMLGSLVSLLVRRRAKVGALGLDELAIVCSLHLALLGVSATLLAWAGWFSGSTLALLGAALALAVWPWRTAQPVARGRIPVNRHTAILLAVVGIGILLRLPSIPAPLAGRDQGSYVLRAASTVRTGALAWTDDVLAQAGRDRTDDILGLYPKTDEPWRADRYEAAYRPGSYLASRDRGEVVPQFFHLHPMLLACERAALGDRWPTGSLILPWQAGVWLLVMACIARGLWPSGAWAALGLGLLAAAPLAIWTQRTPLSETTMGLFEWSAVLVALRMRESGDEREEPALAMLLAATAWVRGNALLVLPIVLAIAWLRPRPRPRDAASSAAWIVLIGLLASVVLHVLTVFPYLHDELLRRAPGLELGPAELIGLATIATGIWLTVDRLVAHPRFDAGRAGALAWLPRVWTAATLLGFLAWWLWRSGAEPGKPFSRLDPIAPLLGLPSLIAAAVGLVWLGWTWRPRGGADAWLVAIASIVPVTVWMYAPRNLPGMGLFYYGRYLVPELLPAVVLAAVGAVAVGVTRLELRSRVAAGVLGLLTGASLVWTFVGPLAADPQLRLRENESAGPAIDWLASRIPPGAIVIAGGEGWHHGHTFNQVGGALALGEGIAVVPYRTREDAWSSAWEFLVAGPARRDGPPPPVFLLVNEAAHVHRDAEGRRVALLDDLLWPPFVIDRVDLLELVVHALTPLEDAMPTRVAQHELRMGLIRIAVDPDALANIEWIVPPSSCLDPERPLVVELPPGRADVAHLVIVAAPGTASANPNLRVTVDGEPLALEPLPGLRPHPRATLGPYPLARRPSRIEILADGSGGGTGRCEHGEIAELRLLGRERSGLLELATERIEAKTFMSATTIGPAYDPVSWIGGRSLTRHRPGIRGVDQVVGEGLVLPAGGTLEFPLVDLPVDRAGKPRPLEVIVSLSGTEAPSGQVRLYVDELLLASHELPEPRTTVWSTPSIFWMPDRDRASIRIELVAPSGRVLVRDVALFVVGPGVASQ